MYLIVAVITQKYREDKEGGETRKYSRNNRHPQMTSPTLRIQCSIRACESDEKIKLPDSNRPE